MARLDYARKKKTLIYSVAVIIAICCIVFSACNNDTGTYDVSDKNSELEVTHFIAKFMVLLNDGIGNFGWTVIAFTVILKLILSPLDIWQKVIARKNSKAMERMKPQLEALQAKYGDDKQRYQQEQMALYKKEKYSMLGSCLPTIVTLVVFFIIFAGFRQMVGYQFASDYQKSYATYDTAMTSQLGDEWEMSTQDAAEYSAAKEIAQKEVYEFYSSDDQKQMREFLWIKNVFVPDSWKTAVPDYVTVTGQSGFATSKMEGVMKNEYEDVMGKVLNTGGWGKEGKWNGWLLLPVLSILLSLVSQKMLTKAQGTPPPAANGKAADSMQANMKMMQYTMPIMIGVFALFYSGAFALYMFVSSLVSVVFQLVFNLVGKCVDVMQSKKGI